MRLLLSTFSARCFLLSFLILFCLPTHALEKNQKIDGNQHRHILADGAGVARYSTTPGLKYWLLSLAGVTDTDPAAWLPTGHSGLLFQQACATVSSTHFDRVALKDPSATFTLIMHLTIPHGVAFNADSLGAHKFSLTCTLIEQPNCSGDGCRNVEGIVLGDYTWKAVAALQSPGLWSIQALNRLD